MPAVNLGLLTPRAQPNPYVVPVEYPGILYDYSMGPARPYRPLDSILDPIGQAASEIFGEGSRVVVGSGSNIDHHGDGEALPRHGSNRHETGTAADFTVYRPDGSVVDPMSDDGRAYALRAAELGILGVGFGPEYMGNAYHMDLVEPGAGQGHVWASGASSMGDQLIAAMQGNTGVPGGVVASAAGRPASAPVSGQGASSMGRGGQQQEQQPFGQRLRDSFRTGGSAWDTLAVGLNGMTLRPDPGLQGLAGGRIADRREAEREERRLNQTAEWLRSIGRDDLATAVLAGGVAPGAAGGIALAPDPNADEPPAPETVAWLRQNGQENLAVMVEQGLIQPSAALQQAMASPDQPSSVQQYEYLLGQGIDPEQALELAFGGGGTTVNVGGQSEVGTIPQGYELFTDPETGARSLRPIPGGPEDRSEAEAAAAAGEEETGQLMLEDIGRAMELIRENPNLTTGVLGNMLANVPGSSAADLQALMDTIAANISFDALQQMRAASPTGGALGAISELELQLLQATAGSISTAQSPEQLVRNLERLARQFNTIVHGPNGAPSEAAQAPGGWADLEPNVQAILRENHDEETLRRWYGDFQ
jgi:hypothetical protein